MNACFSAKKDRRCATGWKLSSEIGRGGYGHVSDVCCEQNCQYVAKIQRLSRVSVNEAHYLQKCRGICPEVVDSWFCQTDEIQHVLILPKLKTTLNGALTNLSNDLQRELIHKTIELVQQFHQLGFSHGDLKSDNIMIDYDIRDDLTTYRLYLIDFGYVSLLHLNPDAAYLDFKMLRNDLRRQKHFELSEEIVVPKPPQLSDDELDRLDGELLEYQDEMNKLYKETKKTVATSLR